MCKRLLLNVFSCLIFLASPALLYGQTDEVFEPYSTLIDSLVFPGFSSIALQSLETLRDQVASSSSFYEREAYGTISATPFHVESILVANEDAIIEFPPDYEKDSDPEFYKRFLALLESASQITLRTKSNMVQVVDLLENSQESFLIASNEQSQWAVVQFIFSQLVYREIPENIEQAIGWLSNNPITASLISIKIISGPNFVSTRDKHIQFAKMRDQPTYNVHFYPNETDGDFSTMTAFEKSVYFKGKTSVSTAALISKFRNGVDWFEIKVLGSVEDPKDTDSTFTSRYHLPTIVSLARSFNDWLLALRNAKDLATADKISTKMTPILIKAENLNLTPQVLIQFSDQIATELYTDSFFQSAEALQVFHEVRDALQKGDGFSVVSFETAALKVALERGQTDTAGVALGRTLGHDFRHYTALYLRTNDKQYLPLLESMALAIADFHTLTHFSTTFIHFATLNQSAHEPLIYACLYRFLNDDHRMKRVFEDKGMVAGLMTAEDQKWWPAFLPLQTMGSIPQSTLPVLPVQSKMNLVSLAAYRSLRIRAGGR